MVWFNIPILTVSRTHYMHLYQFDSYRFRHLLSQEASTHSMNRSLVAVKEHGVLITDELNTGYQPFWVIGFVFFSSILVNFREF